MSFKVYIFLQKKKIKKAALHAGRGQGRPELGFREMSFVPFGGNLQVSCHSAFFPTGFYALGPSIALVLT